MERNRQGREFYQSLCLRFAVSGPEVVLPGWSIFPVAPELPSRRLGRREVTCVVRERPAQCPETNRESAGEETHNPGCGAPVQMVRHPCPQ